MKKMILLAAFSVAGLVHAKTAELKTLEKQNEQIKLSFQLCGVKVNFYDSEGNLTGSQWYVTDAPTLSSCQVFQTIVKWNLIHAGFSITAE